MDSSLGHGQHRPQVPEPTHCQFHQFHHHSLLVPHHHHFHVSPHCPLHSYMLHCPGFVPWHPPSLNPETLASVPFPENPLRLQVSQSKETIFNTLVMHEEETVETVEMEEEREQHEEEEEEEEDDPVFVLTDEWREFFAKSEAKRRLAKKQARKQKEKNRMEQ